MEQKFKLTNVICNMIDVTFTALSNSLDIIEANMKHKIKTQLQDILNKLN